MPKRKLSRETAPFQDYMIQLKGNGILKEITQSVKDLCVEKYLSFSAIRIDQCDAGVGYGVPFSQASCVTTEMTEEFYPFASIFEKGLSALNKVLNNFEYQPIDFEEEKLLRILFKYLANKDCLNFILTLYEKPLKNETHLAIALTEHLFNMLTEPGYVVGNHWLQEDIMMCHCGCKKIVVENQANTSIGHAITWHGNLDVIVGKDASVPVKLIESTSSTALVESTKCKTHDEIDSISTEQQIMAQTIVFSFLQKKRHPELQFFLFPCLGVSFTEITFYCYDCENDILLKSRPMLFKKSGKINYELVLAIWLTLNYKHFSSGLSDRLKKAPKAGFMEKAKMFLHVYRENLSQGDEIESIPPEKVDPCEYPEAIFVPVSKFHWPVFD